MEIKGYSIEELKKLSSEIREKIIDSVAKNGGHLSSTLGAVELIVGMHYVLIRKKTHLYLMFLIKHMLTKC